MSDGVWFVPEGCHLLISEQYCAELVVVRGLVPRPRVAASRKYCVVKHLQDHDIFGQFWESMGIRLACVSTQASLQGPSQEQAPWLIGSQCAGFCGRRALTRALQGSGL